MKWLALLILTGCHSITEYPASPRTVAICNEARVVLHVTYHDSVDTVQNACRQSAGFITYGCAKVLVLEGERHAYLHLVRLKDFNDAPVLKVMGHELCHALGGEHE